MALNVPQDLQIGVNRRVLEHVEGLSAHSDVVAVLDTALTTLGDVQVFCPSWQEYRCVIASTKGVVFALAAGMGMIGFRLDERMQEHALACGGFRYPECGDEWVAFTLFRPDWPKVDVEFWARKAYVYARARGDLG